MWQKTTIRKGKPDDLSELQQLFVDTITAICRADYEPEQIDVWASGIEDVTRWKKILSSQFVLVALRGAQIVGFVTLDNGRYIDLFYVHKAYQRQGIARKLYIEIEKEAIRQKQTELTADVSKTARPFFESVGFDKIKEQKIVKKGTALTNFKMTKRLIFDST